GRRGGGAQLPARGQVVLAGFARDGHRSGRLLPSETGRDRRDRLLRALDALVAVHVVAERQAAGRIEARVVDGVEEVLQRARHVAKVGEGAERSEDHTSALQSREKLVSRLLVDTYIAVDQYDAHSPVPRLCC